MNGDKKTTLALLPPQTFPNFSGDVARAFLDAFVVGAIGALTEGEPYEMTMTSSGQGQERVGATLSVGRALQPGQAPEYVGGSFPDVHGPSVHWRSVNGDTNADATVHGDPPVNDDGDFILAIFNQRLGDADQGKHELAILHSTPKGWLTFSDGVRERNIPPSRILWWVPLGVLPGEVLLYGQPTSE